MNPIILLLAAFQGTVLSLAFLAKIVKADYFRFYIGLIFLVISIELWTYWGIQTGDIQSRPIFPYWNLGPYLLLPPALQFILLRLRLARKEVTKADLLLLLPAIFALVINLVKYYTLQFFRVQVKEELLSLWQLYTQVFPLIWLAFVLLWQFRYKSVKKKYIFVHAYFTLFFLIWVIDYAFPHQVFFYVESMLVASMFVFGYIAYLKPSLFSPPKVSSLDLQYGDYDHQKTAKTIQIYLQKKEVFTQPELSLQKLAVDLNLSPKYVSYLINKEWGVNFKSYLNTLRIEYVIAALATDLPKRQTLLSIGLEAGFNSKSSFNASFKAITGLSPSAYLKAQKK